MNEIILNIFMVVSVVLLITIIVIMLVFHIKNNDDDIKETIVKSVQAINQENSNSEKRIADYSHRLTESLAERINNLSISEEQKLEALRKSMNENLLGMRQDNDRKLNEIRATVDEKLTEHLETTLSKSFEAVSKQLESVYKSVGEMQSLATGVGDLKKVLSNTKSRGILGEVQLSGILKEILSIQQYEENVATVHGSTERVEFAVKLPSGENENVYLPIDAKFPAETYIHLQDAIEDGDKAQIEQARKELVIRLKSEAKDIHDKYIHVPETTEFGIMFLPTEGLYAEACNLGMMETLQREYHITIAGPSTMAALLNSLQMGFRTLAIQKRSNEVWKILGNAKSEFTKFEDVLTNVQKRLTMTSDELDKLVGTRTKAINRSLRNVEVLINDDTPLLEEGSDE